MLFSKFVAATVVSGLPLLAQATHVIEATDKTLASVLKPGLPTMLDIYASWCGHCKKLSPVYDELSDLFAHAQDKVQFVKIDGDKNRKASKQYKVEYYPTLKFINADGSINEVDVRDLDGMAEYVFEQTGVMPRKAPALPSAVYTLNDTSFDDSIKGKNALVTFTAGFCGHCKNMKPDYEKVAHIYARDSDNLLIANVDCSAGQPTSDLAAKYVDGGYPTILFFPKDGSDPIPYRSGRTVDAFVNFLTEQGVGFRNADGSLNTQAGKDITLDALASKVASSGSNKDAETAAISNLKAAAADVDNGNIYVKYADKYAANGGASYVQKETARLSKLLTSKTLAATKRDELQTKLNILKSFVPSHSHDDL
ncbi:protein disulfide isomerase PDI1 [Sugiyamaella lignohabitans]|uniref:protein disulfide-isomerase n=1 Tax=Sugiyamaella lignohabitans TaxID=796027 RepID=A0A167EI20_9ASCO|nr:protein disulfide isomerase PDI1 [Sugiyamaella lignohabitans]ANB14111.1 protein disulfide isomerase PDI1 [Sugiyamaella lignohabitans]